MQQHTFTFAGFTWPRPVADMAIGHAALKAKRELRKVCGGYTHAPRPDSTDGRGFYLGDAGMPSPRWIYSDESSTGHGAQHTYWSDEFTSFRGLVLRLPHGRFLAGWTMGERMASAVESQLFDDEHEAAMHADECARVAAEHEADYQADESARIDAEEREAAINDVD